VSILKRTHRHRRSTASLTHRLWLVAFLIAAALVIPSLSHAATLNTASTALSDPRPSAGGTSYTFTGSGVTLASIKCIQIVFSTAATGGTVPSGMLTTGASLDAASDYMPTPASWTVNNATNGTVTITYATGQTPASGSARTVKLDGILNASTSGVAYFELFNTYSDAACTTPVDSAAVQFILTTASTLTLTVNDTLSFAVNAVAASTSCDGTTTTAASTSTTIPFGTVTAASNAVVCQQLTAASNSTNGYTVYARYTQKPTNALNQTIADLTPGTNAAPSAFSAAGTEAYGYSTSDAALGTGTPNRFTSPTQGWAAMTTSNAEVAYQPGPSTSTTFNVAHQVGVSLITKPGTYVTTIIYTCTPIY
jgi:hypothetical protein